MIYLDTSADETLVRVKAGRGHVDKIRCYSLDTADLFIQCFDAAATTDVTLGTTTPTAVFGVPAANGAGTLRGFLLEDFDSDDLQFQLGLVVAVTTTPTGNTGPTVADPVLEIFYH